MSFKESVIRTDSENAAFIKVRRTTTAPVRVAECSLTVKAEVVNSFINWYSVSCQCGAIPTKIKIPPTGVEEVWRFSAAPTVDWIDPKAAQITWSMEQLPLWRA
jgi:hypothetical protein